MIIRPKLSKKHLRSKVRYGYENHSVMILEIARDQCISLGYYDISCLASEYMSELIYPMLKIDKIGVNKDEISQT